MDGRPGAGTGTDGANQITANHASAPVASAAPPIRTPRAPRGRRHQGGGGGAGSRSSRSCNRWLKRPGTTGLPCRVSRIR